MGAFLRPLVFCRFYTAEQERFGGNRKILVEGQSCHHHCIMKKRKF